MHISKSEIIRCSKMMKSEIICQSVEVKTIRYEFLVSVNIISFKDQRIQHLNNEIQSDGLHFLNIVSFELQEL